MHVWVPAIDATSGARFGDSNRFQNLWPEPYDITWNAHVKDRLENRYNCEDVVRSEYVCLVDWLSGGTGRCQMAISLYAVYDHFGTSIS